MALRQVLVFLYCKARGFLRLAPALAGRYRAEEGQKRVSLGHMGGGRGVVWVERDGLTILVNALLQIEIIEVIVCPQIVLVRLGIYWLHFWCWGWLRTSQTAFDLLSDIRRYFVLQGEHVAEVAFISIGPEMPIVRGANQLRRDAHTSAGALHRAFHYGVRIELMRDCRQRLLGCFVLDRRGAGNHLQTFHSRQVGRQRLRHAIGEVVLCSIAGEVLQGQNNNRPHWAAGAFKKPLAPMPWISNDGHGHHSQHDGGKDSNTAPGKTSGCLLYTFHRRNEAVAALRKCFDVPRRIRIIVQGRSHFPDAEVQAMLKINEGFASPNILA